MRSKKLLMIATSVFVLSACGLPEQSTKADSPESLLDAQGRWAMVEADREDATDLHSKAKNAVHTNDMSRHMEYAKKVRGELKKDMNFRLLRLERQMADVNRTLEKALPGYVARNYDSYQAMGVPAPAHVEATADKVNYKKKPVAPVKKMAAAAPDLSGASAVKRLRFGEHPGKTRMVLDLNKPSHYSYDLDNAEKLMLIDIVGSSWDTLKVKKMANHPLIASYSAQDNGNGGTMLVLELKRPVKVLSKMALQPNPKSGGYHRIVLDLAAQ